MMKNRLFVGGMMALATSVDAPPGVTVLP